ncbi:hypothetical protein LINGRAHAP2_LOCUS1987 [Linum grandiflorum]
MRDRQSVEIDQGDEPEDRDDGGAGSEPQRGDVRRQVYGGVALILHSVRLAGRIVVVVGGDVVRYVSREADLQTRVWLEVSEMETVERAEEGE